MSFPVSDWVAEHVPYRFRWFHRWWANLGGFFWSPCPLCSEYFGGHEWRPIDGKPSSVSDSGSPNIRVGICPQCTRAGHGTR
jgi:hypothetical protein